MNRTNRVLTDLNLLRVFLTIWDMRGLTAAGHRLGLTQPAVSHALRRLRETFGDPLFVRVTNGMVPTELATKLHPPLSEALRIIQRAVQDSERFDPSTASRVFRLAMSDVGQFYYLPALMKWLTQVAPHVRLDVAQLAPATIEQSMRAGEVDLTIGFLPGLGEDVTGHRLLSDRFVCLVRAGHPMTRENLSDTSLAELGYVYASTAATGHHLAEQWLTELGIKRQIVLRLGHFMIAPNVVRDSDLAVIFPESVAKMINHDDAFALLPLPPGGPVIDISVHTHEHFRGDLGIGWLRDALVTRFGQGSPPPEPTDG